MWPASHYATEEETLERAVIEIKAELDERLAWFHERGKELEAHRLLQRTQYDIEMLKELGFTSGIENYSRIFDGREPGSPPHTLIDYFPDDFVTFVDESHQTVPQIGGMYEGDRSRTPPARSTASPGSNRTPAAKASTSRPFSPISAMRSP